MAEAPVRPEIALSWRRSQSCGLTPASTTSSLTIADVDRGSWLIRAAGPVLDDMAAQLADTRFGLLLADRECRIVDRRFGRRAVGATLDAIRAAPGFQFTEETTGTNALSTPAELRKGVSVTGAEHFFEEFREFACYGQPIIHPTTRRLEGVLDISGHVEDANPLLGPFLARAVADIERALVEHSRGSEARLFAAYQAAQHRPHAVLALGDDIVLANRAAVDLVDTADHTLLRELALDAMAMGRSGRSLRLTSGHVVDVQVERIGGSGGAVFQVRPRNPLKTPVPRRAHRAGPRIDGLGRQIARRRAERSRVLITGEAGSGRTTAVQALAGDAPLRSLDAADLPTTGEEAWCIRLNEALVSHPGLVVVESAHLLTDAAAAALAKAMDACSAWLALTATSVGDPKGVVGPFAAIAARCPVRIELRPLRARREELPELVQKLLAAQLPGRSLRVTPSALELLRAQQWPGNLRELEAVLHHAAGQRGDGDITAQDLPAAYRRAATRRRLTAWEQAEHDAITAALAACGGNKVHAAEHLGISRSTLYNRIRALGIS